MRIMVPLLSGLLLAASASCDGPTPTVVGVRTLIYLPAGDVEQGKIAFVERGCNACHEVEGEDLPDPVATPPVPVVLRTRRRQNLSDGELVTAIIAPSHSLAVAYPRKFIESNGISRMGNSNSHMTVQQLIDIVSFLKRSYRQERERE